MIIRTVLLYLFSLPVIAETFQAPINDTEWLLVNEPLQCSLMQTLPGFGQAGFQRYSGGNLRLVFETTLFPADGSNIVFAMTASSWKNNSDVHPLATYQSVTGQSRFELNGTQAEYALAWFQKSRFPLITYKPIHYNNNINVTLTSVNLNDVLPTFQLCLNTLPKNSADTGSHLTIYFNLADASLDQAAKDALKQLADFIKTDASIRQIHIAGHTDSTGQRKLNETLSVKRANTVKHYLVQQQGIPIENILTRSLSDAKPAASNSTPLGRAENRRVEIQLIR